MRNMIFKDRSEAGQLLAKKIIKYDFHHPIVLAMPRGGIIVGKPVSQLLKCPFSVIVTKKISYPGKPEFVIGAISRNQTIFNPNVDIESIPKNILKKELSNKRRELRNRINMFNTGKYSLKGKDVIIVDDGITTGIPSKVAISEVMSHNPRKIILAIPVIPHALMHKTKKVVDKLIYLMAPNLLFSVGQYYEYFPQIKNEEAIRILQQKN